MLDYFDRSDQTPQYWFNCANDLRGSAAALCHSMKQVDVGREIRAKYDLGDGYSLAVACPPVYEMLCGLSFELLLKAIAVAQRKDVQTHHQLVTLARFVGVSLTDSEAGLLQILSMSIRWSGRYPRPKQRSEWESDLELRRQYLWQPVPGFEVASEYNGGLDWTHMASLWNKLEFVYREHHFDA